MNSPTTDSVASPPALLPAASSNQIRGYLRGLMRGRWRWVVATIGAMVIDSALGLVGPIAIGWITQAIADHRPKSALAGPVILLAVATLAAAAIGWASTVLLARIVLPALARLREDAVSTAMALPIDTVEAGGIGDLVSRVSGDVERVTDAAEGALGSFIAAGLTILSTLAGLAALDWRFALAGLLAVPVQAHTLRWYLRTSRPIYAAGRIADGERTSALLSGFTALPTLRALRLGSRQQHRIEATSARSMDYEFRAIGTATRFYGRLNGAEFIGLGAILLVAFLLVRADLAAIGAATTAALFFAGLFDPINSVLGSFDSMQQAGAGLARLIGITTAERHQDTAPISDGTNPGTALEVAGVHFGYGKGPDVLHDINLSLTHGEHVAVVGATGSGKSTFASLLAGIRHPRTGQMTFDPTVTTDVDEHTLHRRVALVTQETHLFAGTVADNLCLARPDASAAEIIAALNIVGAGDWVAALPHGVDTLVGSGGDILTAAQAQQLALARLILLDPAVVILDEATAEGGSDAARALDRAAQQVIQGRSAVIIAHRLSQAADADTILVMDNGVIIERGTHTELLTKQGGYAALWAAWTRGM